ncbi:zinc transporter ZntB [Hyphomonas johnsonii]|jgi:zinc transporter|uniref:Mg2 transporter protein CorA family protein n=1 Tax=Hyphomonas johnsonii MHS-2 TaxID=1280950 RepID=A0A059FEC0_9PROT|nr:zinc transporter ZntB [Hyphomonas johnsonii]KCZ88896.1 Mg2 transporter protein CorA family protein [Hyphomonas johnsonii MHS-2]
MIIEPALVNPTAEDDLLGVDPFIFGYGFAADGAPTRLTWEDLISGKAAEYPRYWVHLNRLSKQAHGWIFRKSGLDRVVAHALVQEETRPRSQHHGRGFLINLRAVNQNEGADPEDMVALRMWASDTVLITVRARPVQATRDVEAWILAGDAPNSNGGLVAALASALTNRMEPEVANLDSRADTFEDQVLDPDVRMPRAELAEFRRTVLGLRRYLVPQREALSQLLREGSADGLFPESIALQLRESVDRVTRLAEDLDAIRERSVVLQEQIMEERTDLTNQRLFVLSLLSAVFLPISFVTGLFGVNLGGMPGINSPMAFAILSLVLLGTTGLMLAIFRWRRWM